MKVFLTESQTNPLHGKTHTRSAKVKDFDIVTSRTGASTKVTLELGKGVKVLLNRKEFLTMTSMMLSTAMNSLVKGELTLK